MVYISYGAIIPISRVSERLRVRLYQEFHQINQNLDRICSIKNTTKGPLDITEVYEDPLGNRKSVVWGLTPVIGYEVRARLSMQLSVDQVSDVEDAVRDCRFTKPFGALFCKVYSDSDDWEEMEPEKPWVYKPKQCTCGAHAAYGKDCPIDWHFTWCDLREGTCRNNPTTTFLR